MRQKKLYENPNHTMVNGEYRMLGVGVGIGGGSHSGGSSSVGCFVVGVVDVVVGCGGGCVVVLMMLLAVLLMVVVVLLLLRVEYTIQNIYKYVYK